MLCVDWVTLSLSTINNSLSNQTLHAIDYRYITGYNGSLSQGPQKLDGAVTNFGTLSHNLASMWYDMGAFLPLLDQTMLGV